MKYELGELRQSTNTKGTVASPIITNTNKIISPALALAQGLLEVVRLDHNTERYVGVAHEAQAAIVFIKDQGVHKTQLRR